MDFSLHYPLPSESTHWNHWLGMQYLARVLKPVGLTSLDDDITSIGADARLVLGEEIRHSILSLTLADENGKTA